MAVERSGLGAVSSGIQRLMRREIAARTETITGTVLSVRQLKDLDANSSASWVVDVDVGADIILRNVAVKAGSNGSRFYADLGQTVKLSRNTRGKFDVIGPGDRRNSLATVKTYALGNATPLSTATRGLQIDRVAFEFYANIANPGFSFWNDGLTPFPLTRVVDAAGVPVP